MLYTACTLKLRPVKLLFVIFGRLSYSFFVQIMVSGNGRLSYILWKNGRFLAQIGQFRTDFWPAVVQMTFHNDVFFILIIKDCIYIKGKLISAKISAQNSEIRQNFAWITFFRYGRLSLNVKYFTDFFEFQNGFIQTFGHFRFSDLYSDMTFWPSGKLIGIL